MSQCRLQILKTGPLWSVFEVIAVRFITTTNKQKLKDKEMCKKSKTKCNMENLLKGHLVCRHKIQIFYVNSKYHTTTDHKKCHVKSIVGRIYVTVLCVANNPSPGATWRAMKEKFWILMHCVEGKSYPGTTQRDTVKGLLRRIHITVLCVAKDLSPIWDKMCGKNSDQIHV